MSIKQKIIHIHGKSQTNKDQKSNILLFNDMINLKDFESDLLEIGKKYYKGIDIYYIGYVTIK